MPVLAAGEVVLAAVVLLNLALTLALIKRFRDTATPPGPVDPGGASVGRPAPAFTAASTTGTLISPESFAGEQMLIAFFDSNCKHCLEEAPAFARSAADLARRDIRTLAVVSRDDTSPGDQLIASLDGLNNVIVEDRPGIVGSAFTPEFTPAYYFIDSAGTVSGRGISMGRALDQAKAADLVSRA